MSVLLVGMIVMIMLHALILREVTSVLVILDSLGMDSTVQVRMPHTCRWCEHLCLVHNLCTCLFTSKCFDKMLYKLKTGYPTFQILMSVNKI